MFRRHIFVIISKTADCKFQLVTDITLHIAFEEPALKEMVAENTSQLLLTRTIAERINLINNMATDKVNMQCHLHTQAFLKFPHIFFLFKFQVFSLIQKSFMQDLYVKFFLFSNLHAIYI